MKPTSSGWWWRVLGGEPVPVRVLDNGRWLVDGRYHDVIDDGRWLGPCVPPSRPDSATGHDRAPDRRPGGGA